MLRLAGTGIISSLQQAGYGYIEWNLPEVLEYQAGQAIPMMLRVTNPSIEAREYQLYLGLYDPETGELIADTLELVEVNEEDSFTVAGESYIEMEGDLAVDRSNVTLAILLYDVASETTSSYVATLLSTPAAGQDLTPVFGSIFAIAALGMMVPAMTGMSKE